MTYYVHFQIVPYDGVAIMALGQENEKMMACTVEENGVYSR